jgi:hypothetical protein
MDEKRKLNIDVNTLVAVSISVLTVFSALLGWQMGNVSGEASGEYAKGQRAELNAQRAQSVNTLNASENHRAFLQYKRYYDEYQLASAKLLEAQSADAEKRDETLILNLQNHRMELRALYLSNLELFPNDFITHEGAYDTEAQVAQMWADAARDEDLYPDPHMRAGRALDAQVQKMQNSLLLLAVSLFFFAIISTVESLTAALRKVFLAFGYLSALAGIIIGVLYWS